MLPLILGAAAVLGLVGGTGYYLYEENQKKTAVPKGAMTPDRTVIFQTAMSTVTDPAKLRALADEFEKQGLPDQAAQLRAKAAQIESGQTTVQPKLNLPSPMPNVTPAQLPLPSVSPVTPSVGPSILPTAPPPVVFNAPMMMMLTMQRTLNKLGANPRLAEDGDETPFDAARAARNPSSKAALVKFQSAHGLPATGFIDQPTSNALTDASLDPALAAATQLLTNVVSVVSPPLMMMLPMQRALNKLGANPRVAEDGDNTPFDAARAARNPSTKAALVKFQTGHGLPASGWVDQVTSDALNAAVNPVMAVLELG